MSFCIESESTKNRQLKISQKRQWFRFNNINDQIFLRNIFNNSRFRIWILKLSKNEIIKIGDALFRFWNKKCVIYFSKYITFNLRIIYTFRNYLYKISGVFKLKSNLMYFKKCILHFLDQNLKIASPNFMISK